MISAPKAVFHFLKKADLIVGVGASFTVNPWTPKIPPGKRIVHTDRFDAGLVGTMTVTIEIKKVMVGTEVHITQEGVPPPAQCTAGPD